MQEVRPGGGAPPTAPGTCAHGDPMRPAPTAWHVRACAAHASRCTCWHLGFLTPAFCGASSPRRRVVPWEASPDWVAVAFTESRDAPQRPDVHDEHPKILRSHRALL